MTTSTRCWCRGRWWRTNSERIFVERYRIVIGIREPCLVCAKSCHISIVRYATCLFGCHWSTINWTLWLKMRYWKSIINKIMAKFERQHQRQSLLLPLSLAPFSQYIGVFPFDFWCVHRVLIKFDLIGMDWIRSAYLIKLITICIKGHRFGNARTRRTRFKSHFPIKPTSLNWTEYEKAYTQTCQWSRRPFRCSN